MPDPIWYTKYSPEPSLQTILPASQITSIYVPTALPNNILDFRVTTNIQESAQNIQAKRNQIIVRDKTILNAAAGRDAGLTVNVSSVVE